jgi:hypothetical protein
MSVHTFEYEPKLVLPFVQSLLPGLKRAEGMRTIGLRKDGELVAGVVYEGFNGRNVWMHVAGLPGRRWLVRDYLRACFAYPFLVCGVERVSGYVNASNVQARQFDEHLGFREEARLQGAAADGGDVMLQAMPPGWPGGWKSMDNEIVLIPDVATWAQFYGSMVAAGTANFNHSQALKAQLAAASAPAEVEAVPNW